MFIVEQPHGYIDPQFSTHFCLLNKTLYDLKQVIMLGFSVSGHFFSHLIFLAMALTCPFLSFISNLTLFICFFMFLTLLLPTTTYSQASF